LDPRQKGHRGQHRRRYQSEEAVTWNYRIVKYNSEDPMFGLHEIYYDKNGKPDSRTETPMVVGETPEEVIAALEMALEACKTKPVLEDSW